MARQAPTTAEIDAGRDYENDGRVTPPTLPRRLAPPRGLATAAALAVALAATGPVHAAAPKPDFEQLIAQADEHTSAGRHAEALRSYTEAFRVMPQSLKSSGVGEFVALGAGSAAIEDFRARGDRTSLADGRLVLMSFIGAAKRADPATSPAPIDSAKERLAEIDALMPTAGDTAVAPTPAVEADETDAPPEAPRDDAPAPDRSGLGIGLVVAGGVATLAGLGLVIAGARQVPWYEAKLASQGWTPTDEGYDAQIADAERVRNLDLGLGAAVLVVGVGLGIGGAVVLAKQRKRGGREVAVLPVLGRDRAMLGVTARF